MFVGVLAMSDPAEESIKPNMLRRGRHTNGSHLNKGTQLKYLISQRSQKKKHVEIRKYTHKQENECRLPKQPRPQNQATIL